MTQPRELSDAEWLDEQFAGLTTEWHTVLPSEWAEENRYLSPAETSMPGFYRFAVAPYLKEIVDCMSVDSPVREIACMKGVQVCFTSGVIENAIGYFAAHVKTAPMMFVTADKDLAKLRMDGYIKPMFRNSGLQHLIQSSDQNNRRKTGDTDKKIEWKGGGFLLPFGAQNANKLRSFPIQALLRDEIDGWPLRVGKDGDPMTLSADRTASYEATRKILDTSTPLLESTSQIAKRFRLGDQRYYNVPCLECGVLQVLRWQRSGDDGVQSGIVWDIEDGRLVPGSVRYLCEACGHPHRNEDKTRMLDPKNGAKWVPTAIPSHPHFRSYHLSALYAPVGLQTWEKSVDKWLKAWDPEANRVRDVEALQVFYNNVLGQTFTARGQKLRFENVSAHRRSAYTYGVINNAWVTEKAGSPVLALTCAVDVHGGDLAVSVFGWARQRRAFLIDYWRFEGSTERLEEPATWGRLRELIEGKRYTADDGKVYRVVLTVIDAGFSNEHVTAFCSEYEAGVYPIIGRSTPGKGAAFKEFAPFTTTMGTVGYRITVDMYKDRWAAALRRHWENVGDLPPGSFSAPMDTTDRQLKELTVETKREKIDKTTGKRHGFYWHRPSGADNELWDLLVYNSAALDMIAWDVCRNELELDAVNWVGFEALAESRGLFWE